MDQQELQAETKDDGDKTADAAQKLAAKEGVEGADDLVVSQRTAMAEQKDPDRPARYTSKTFGRVEILDDQGDALVKGRPADVTNLTQQEDWRQQEVGGEREDSLLMRYFKNENEAENAYKNLLAKQLQGDPLTQEEQRKVDVLNDIYSNRETEYMGLYTERQNGNKLSPKDEYALEALQSIHNFHVKYGKILHDLCDKDNLTDQEKRFIKVLSGYRGIANRAGDGDDPVPEVM